MADEHLFHPHQKREHYEKAVLRSIDALTPIADQFDSIVVIGASGAAVGAVVAYLMHKNLVVVRKGNENPHCYTDMTGTLTRADRTVWLDDFICGGSTLARVIEVLTFRPKWVLLYYSGSKFSLRTKEEVGYTSTASEYLFEDDPYAEDLDPKFYPNR